MGGILCCCCKKFNDDRGEYVQYKDRKCTDFLCCIIYAVFFLVMAAVPVLAYVLGSEPLALLYGTDFEGNTCGTGDLADKHLTYYPKFTQDLVAFQAKGFSNPLDITLFGVCMSKCPNMGDVVCTSEGETAMGEFLSVWSDMPSIYTTEKDKRAGAVHYCKKLDYQIDYEECRTVSSRCWLVPLRTVNYFFRCWWAKDIDETVTETCLSPESLAGRDIEELEEEDLADACITKRSIVTSNSTQAAQSNPVLDQVYSTGASISRAVTDVRSAWLVVVLAGCVGAMVVGFLFIFLMKYFAGCMVWFTIIGIFFAFVACTLYAYARAGILNENILNDILASLNESLGTNFKPQELPDELQQADADSQSKWEILAYILTGLTVILLLLIIALRKRIRIAVAIIREASRAIRKLPSLLCYPFLTLTTFVAFFAAWIVGAMLVAGIGEDVKASDALGVVSGVRPGLGGKLGLLIC